MATDTGASVDAQTTLEHAVEALRRSDRPLSAAEILTRIPPPSRVKKPAMETLLASDSRVHQWPPARGTAQYWTITKEEASASAVANLLAEAAWSRSAIEKKLKAHVRPKPLGSYLDGLVAGGKLYKYPPRGSFRVRYSARPASAAEYAKGLRKEFEKLAARLAPAGVSREQILTAIAETAAPPAAAAPESMAQRILAYVSTKPGGVYVGQARIDLGAAGAEKASFDEAVLGLYREGRVFLDRHDFPSGLTEAEREDLVTDGSGTYFTLMGPRDAEPVP